jgi:molecular chaperone DnaK
MADRPVLGIDLGSYNSGASVLLGDVPTMVKSREGVTEQGMGFPSFVEFDESGELLRAGEIARRAADVHPDRVVWGAKRLIGKSYRQVRRSGDHERFQYRVTEGDDGGCRIVVGRREYTPTEIASFVLAKIKSDAEAGFNPIGGSVLDCVITVPAYFGPLQKAETRKAAELAGFDSVLLIPEPTSAALAYRLQLPRTTQYVVVIDLGAGTLDVTVALLYADDTGTLCTQEQGHGGDTALGGIDIDQAIVDAVTRRHRLKRVLRDPVGRARLRGEIERAKIRLSTEDTAHVAFAHRHGAVDLVLSRAEVEAAAAPWIDRCRGPIRIALREAGVAPADVAHVLLVGGPTQMPLFRAMVAGEFGTNPRVLAELADINTHGFPVNPMEAVAMGAVLGSFGSITPHGYGIMLGHTYAELIPRRSQYPCDNTRFWNWHGGGLSLRLGLIQREIDAKSESEVYTELGSYQFDYRPEPDTVEIEVEAEYSANGTLDFTISQLSTGVSMRLRDVNRFEGQRIRTPSTPLPGPPPTVAPPPGPPPGSAPAPEQPRPAAAWSQAAHDTVIRVATQVLQIARARLDATPDTNPADVAASVDRLAGAVGDRFDDIDTKTPRVANLVREVCHQLLVAGLLTAEESKGLTRRVDGLR